ncbi:PRK06851 family protein [Halanaerocella petrolearia]
MTKGRIKNYFPGGNTCKGFYSFYDYLPDGAELIFVIKGGPGTGKSTFMKRIGQEFVEEGYDIEFHWCSSDSESLDGLVIRDLKVALLDGTAPHLIDPEYPGAVEEIINLGRYWDRSILEEYKDQIVTLNDVIWKLFDRAYAYLKEAKLIHDRWEDYYLEGMDFQQANQKTEELIEDIVGDWELTDSLGEERHLFASAFTPSAVINYFKELTTDLETRYIIKGRPGTGKSTMTKKVAKAIRERGFAVNYFHCSFDPDSVDMIIVPELSVALVDGTAPHIVDPVSDTRDQVVDMLECVDSQIVDLNKEQIEYTKEQYKEVIDDATTQLRKAKKLHDELEEYYIEAMDFSAIDDRCEKVIKRIKDWADIKGYL